LDSATESVTIGAGGSAGSSAGGTGGTGGTSTFGSYHSAVGGAGGVGPGSAPGTNSFELGGSGGVPTNGLINLVGGAGYENFGETSDAAIRNARGGTSYWGCAANISEKTTGSAGVVAGQNAVNYGAGGNGGVDVQINSGTTGGTGADGFCIVIEC